MKPFITIIFSLLLSQGILFPQATLKVEITGLRDNKGKVMLQLFDDKHIILRQEIGDINDKSASFTFRDLVPGKYAVRFYHDENMNRNMETNLVGKPTEGYGFSNNVTGKFGMPSFEKWLFRLEGDKTITIMAVY
jgi:uncharacterized protein (DUF2141 family)